MRTASCRMLLALGCAVAAAVSVGCRPDRPEPIPVRGRITYDGGDMPGPGTLFFAVKHSPPGIPARAGTAAFDVDGQFEAKTWDDTTGLFPGTYAVRVECWETPPAAPGTPGQSHIPARYGNVSTSGLDVTVATDASSVDVHFDLTSQDD